ncbi:MAG: hypothetical protein ACXW27_15110 [Allosphingosinicella sp.]
MEQNKKPESPSDFDATAPGHGIVPLRTHHMPEFVDPLEPRDPDTSFTATRRLRHDGWTPEKKRLFLERFAECGVLVEACEAAGMSAKAAYNLRDRDPLFAAGLDAACVKARGPLADEAYSRARNGVVERLYKDGIVVAERHRYDNRLTMAVLARLDSRIDRAEEKGAPHLALVARWDDYLDAVSEDRREDGLALLSPPEPAPPTAQADPRENAGDRELHELHPGQEAAMAEDRHQIWDEEDGGWTNSPRPAGFDGEEVGRYGDFEYKRALSPAEQAAVDAEDARDAEAHRVRGEAQRDSWFGFSPESGTENGGYEDESRAPGQEPPSIPGDSPAIQAEHGVKPASDPIPNAVDDSRAEGDDARAEGEESHAEGP